MKFTISCAELTAALRHVAKVIPSGNVAAPILSHFLMEVHEGVLTITGSDQTIWMSVALPLISADEDKSFTVLPENILEYIQALPDQPITFEITQQENYEKMTIRHEAGFSEFSISDTSLYPKGLVAADGNSDSYAPRSLSLKADLLLNGITDTYPTLSSDLTRPIYTGIYVDVMPQEVAFVSTDAYTLTRLLVTEPIQRSPESDQANYYPTNAMSIPTKCAGLLRNVLPILGDQEVQIDYNGEKALFVCGNYRITTRLIVGKFPPYQQVIPISNPHKITFDYGQITTALKRLCRSFTGSAVISIFFDFKDANTIELRSQNLDIALKSTERIATQVPEQLIGQKLCIQGAFLLRVLPILGNKEVTMHIADVTRAVLLTPSDDYPGTALSVTVPVFKGVEM